MIPFNKNINPESGKQFEKCMRNAEVFSTRIKVRKPSMQKIPHRNRYQKRSVYYLTCGRNVDDKRLQDEKVNEKSAFAVSKDESDLSYRVKYRESRVEKREKAKLYKYYNWPSYRSKLNEGKPERLYVSTDDMELPGKSLTDDIDAEFFSLVSGRPIREKFNVGSYLKDLQSLFLIRMQIGYKYDETYLMDEMNVQEKKRFKEISDKVSFYAACYDRFLKEDNSITYELLKTAEGETAKSKMKREKIRNLLRECGLYRTKILVMDEQWRIAKVFQKFLYQISHLYGEKEYDQNKETGDIQISDSNLLEKQVTTSLTTVPSVITIADQFIEDVGKSKPPKLYFKDPNEVVQILHELERNNLLALLQCEELTQPAQQMVLGQQIEKARQLFKQEVENLRDRLKSLEEDVIFEESRARDYEKKSKIISFGLFKDLIVDKFILNLYVNVEDCFETCVAPNDSNLPLSMMMRGIEYELESLMCSLDKLPKEIVHKALQTCYKEDARVMKEAYEATKIMVQIENLMKTLRKSLEPKVERKKVRKLLWRSEPPHEKMGIKTQTSTLTKEQLDYLYFFTDFCATTESVEVGSNCAIKNP